MADTVLMIMAGVFAITAGLAQAIAPPVPRKILFVGDSFTYYQDGIYTHFEKLDPSGFAYVPSGVTPEEAAFLQKIGWATVQDYRAGRI